MSYYDEGDGCALVTGRAIVLLAEMPSPALADALWGALAAEAGVLDLLQVLTGTGGLRDLPSFAVVVDDAGSTDVAVRGDVDVRLVGDDGPVALDGRGAMTWAERSVVGVTLVEVAARVAPGGRTFPLVSGVVAAGRVVRGQGEQSGPAPRPALSLAKAGPAESGIAPPPAPVAVPSAQGPSSSGWAPEALDAPVPDGGVSDLSASHAPSSPDDAADDAGLGSDASAAGHEESLPEPGADESASDESASDESASDESASDESATDDAVDLNKVGDADEAGPTDVPPPPPPATADEPEPDGYTHLWGQTVASTVEAAAVRPPEEEDSSEGDPADGGESLDHSAPAEASDADRPAPAGETMIPEITVPPARAKASAPAPATAPVDGMISGIPREFSSPGAHAASPAAPAPVPFRAAPAPVPFPAAPAPVPFPVTPFPATAPLPTDDLDAHTVHSSAIASLRAAAQAASTPTPAPAPAPSGPAVLARVCDCGRTNPPQYDRCAECGRPLDADAVQVPRPSLGSVRLSDGRTVDLDRPLVVGRRPRSTTAASSDLPRLVTVASPQQDISRSHIEVRIEGWHVLVNDLDTTNGTLLRREGSAPRRLHPHLPELVSSGDVIDLGDDVTLTFEDLL